jgi:hypothetical protein
MATKKRKTSHKAAHMGALLAAPAKRRRRRVHAAPVTHRKRRRKSHGLSAGGGAAIQLLAMNSAKVAAGAIGERFLNKAIPATLPPFAGIGIKLAATYVTATMLKQPYIAYGMGAGLALDLLAQAKVPGLSEQSGFPIADEANYVPYQLLNDGEEFTHVANGRQPDGQIVPIYYNHQTGQYKYGA